MKNHYRMFSKSFFGIALFISLFAVPTKAQLGDVGEFLKAGADDATILTREYLKPFPTGFGTGLNAGFTEGAAAKKTLGFSLQIRPSIALVPTSDQSFDISSLGLDKISLAAGESPITPTISGSTGSGPELVINENGNEISRFNMPGGTGIAFVPAPIVQASLGLIKNTDITIRYLPEVSFDDYGSISIIGGAIKHGINQYIPAGKLLPVDLSVMFGFNQIGADANLSLAQVGTRDPNDPNLASNPTPNFNDQQVTTQTSTYVVNVLAGKALPFISVYGGLGFQKASFDLTMEGDYPVPSFNPLTPGEDYVVIQDPVSFTIDSESNVHMLGGFRLRLGFIAFYGEATLANYFTANAGVGISFR